MFTERERDTLVPSSCLSEPVSRVSCEAERSVFMYTSTDRHTDTQIDTQIDTQTGWARGRGRDHNEEQWKKIQAEYRIQAANGISLYLWDGFSECTQGVGSKCEQLPGSGKQALED